MPARCKTDVTEEFPETGRIYLNNASVSRMPASAVRAMFDFVERYNEAGPDSRAAAEMVSDTARSVRRRISGMLRCQPDEIALTQSTTEGINIVAGGISMPAGSNVIIRDATYEHHSNTIPWLDLGAEVRMLKSGEGGLFGMDDFESLLDGDTAAVALTHALYNTGTILPLERVGRLLKGGAPFLVDAAQTVGSVGDYDFSRLGCDFMAFNGSKWLCGPMGVGLLYCSREAAAGLRPAVAGGESAMIYDRTKVAYKAMPDKFEGGYRNYAGLAGLAAALDCVARVGLDAIRGKNQRLCRVFCEEVRPVPGITLHEPAADHIGLVSFCVDGRKSADAVEWLEGAGVIVAQREIGDTDIIRVSPHFYNTEEQMAAAADAVRAFGRTL